MKDLEDIIRNAPLEPVPNSLDNKIRNMLGNGRKQSFFSIPIPLWGCIAACTLCLTAGFLLSAHLQFEMMNQPAAGSVVYLTLPSPKMIEHLDLSSKKNLGDRIFTEKTTCFEIQPTEQIRSLTQIGENSSFMDKN